MAAGISTTVTATPASQTARPIIFFFLAVTCSAVILYLHTMVHQHWSFAAFQDKWGQLARRTAGLPSPPRPRYSSVSCSVAFEGGINNTLSWLTRSCEFHSLCFDSSIQKAWLSVPPTSPLLEPGDASYPETLVSLSPSSSVWKGVPGTPWAPRVRAGEIPANASWAAGTHLLYTSYNAENPGHFLLEELYGWWLLLDTFGLDDVLHSEQATAWRVPAAHPWSCDERVLKGDWEGLQRCSKIGRKFTPLILGQTAINTANVSAQHFPWGATHLKAPPPEAEAGGVKGASNVICFERMLAGTGFNNDHCRDETEHGLYAKRPLCNAGRAGLLRRFARDALRRLDIRHPTQWTGIANVPSCIRGDPGSYRRRLRQDAAPPPPAKPLVVWATSSSSSRSIVNEGNVTMAIRNAVAPEHVRMHDLARLPLKQQLSLMSRAAVFVAMCGGGSAVNIFMPPGSTLIMVCNFGSRRDYHVYNFMPERTVRWVDAGWGAHVTLNSTAMVKLVLQGLHDFACHVAG